MTSAYAGSFKDIESPSPLHFEKNDWKPWTPALNQKAYVAQNINLT